IAVGFLSDRQVRKRFMIVSVTVTTLLLFVLPLSPTFSLIVFLRFIQGFALAGLLGAALAFMAEEIDPFRFGFATTLYIACNSLGGMAGRFITIFLAETYSLQI